MNEFAEELHDVFERFGRITLRRMFGGHGVFHEGRMFGLIIDGRLYLKADAQSAAFFEARGLKCFEYQRQGKTARIGYFEAPPELFEDREEAALWGRRAWEAVLRAGLPKRRPPAKKSPPRRIKGRP
jgi:DNA transformation protein